MLTQTTLILCPTTVAIEVKKPLSMVLAFAVTFSSLAHGADGPQIGAFGLDLSARKLSVKPADDFYTYANGTWVDSFTIPPDRSSYGSFTQLGELSEQARARPY